MAERKFKPDTQAYITLAYLATVAVGMMFDYQYYNHFDINIFEYSDILDFLLAPVKNYELIIFVLATLLILWLFFQLDKTWQNKSPKSYKRFNFGMTKDNAHRYRPFYLGFALITYLFLASVFYGERTLARFQDNPEQIKLTFESGGKSIEGQFIGKNKDYVFLMSADSTIKAVPVSSDVQEIILGKFTGED